MTWMRVLAILVGLAGAAAGRAETLEDGALLNALRHGGYVPVMRHASGPRTPPDRSAAQPDNIKVERELDEEGRETAREMGNAIRQFKVPIGDIESSPTYRALETVKFAGVGKPKSEPASGRAGWTPAEHQGSIRPTGRGYGGWRNARVSARRQRCGCVGSPRQNSRLA